MDNNKNRNCLNVIFPFNFHFQKFVCELSRVTLCIIKLSKLTPKVIAKIFYWIFFSSHSHKSTQKYACKVPLNVTRSERKKNCVWKNFSFIWKLFSADLCSYGSIQKWKIKREMKIEKKKGRLLSVEEFFIA